MSLYGGYSGTETFSYGILPCNQDECQDYTKRPYPRSGRPLQCTPQIQPCPSPKPPTCDPCKPKPCENLPFQLIQEESKPSFSCGSAYLQWSDCDGKCYRSKIESDVDPTYVANAQQRLRTLLKAAAGTTTPSAGVSTANLVSALNEMKIYDMCSTNTYIPSALPAVTGLATSSLRIPAINVGDYNVIGGLSGILSQLLTLYPATAGTLMSSAVSLCFSGCSDKLGTLTWSLSYATTFNGIAPDPVAVRTGTVTLTTTALVAFCDCGLSPVVLQANTIANVSVNPLPAA